MNYVEAGRNPQPSPFPAPSLESSIILEDGVSAFLPVVAEGGGMLQFKAAAAMPHSTAEAEACHPDPDPDPNAAGRCLGWCATWR